jgi:hypothetical protein
LKCWEWLKIETDWGLNILRSKSYWNWIWSKDIQRFRLAEAAWIISTRPFIFPITSPLNHRCQYLLTVAPSRPVSAKRGSGGNGFVAWKFRWIKKTQFCVFICNGCRSYWSMRCHWALHTPVLQPQDMVKTRQKHISVQYSIWIFECPLIKSNSNNFLSGGCRAFSPRRCLVIPSTSIAILRQISHFPYACICLFGSRGVNILHWSGRWLFFGHGQDEDYPETRTGQIQTSLWYFPDQMIISPSSQGILLSNSSRDSDTNLCLRIFADFDFRKRLAKPFKTFVI